MKKFFISTVKAILLVMLCSGLLIGCNDEDDDKNSPISNAIASNDPSYGFMVNSTQYHLALDLGEKEKFEFSLSPGMTIGVRLKVKRTYVLHVVVLNAAGRTVSEYVNSFYIDDVPLDNQLKDYLCSWYVEFTPKYPEYGFANKFGT